MAGDHASAYFLHDRLFLAAFFRCIGAAGMEAASAGRIDRAGDLSNQHVLVFLTQVRVGLGNSLKQELGVRMERILVNVLVSPISQILPRNMTQTLSER